MKFLIERLRGHHKVKVHSVDTSEGYHKIIGENPYQVDMLTEVLLACMDQMSVAVGLPDRRWSEDRMQI